MTINSATYSLRNVKVVGPADTVIPQGAEVHEALTPNPLGPEIVTKTESANFDIHGSPINPDSVLVRCSVSNAPVNIYNAFQCDICHYYYSTFYMAEEIVPDLADPRAQGKPALRHGLCIQCFDKGKWKRVFQAVKNGSIFAFKLIFAPFIPKSPNDPTATPGARLGSSARAISIGLLASSLLAPSPAQSVDVTSSISLPVSQKGHVAMQNNTPHHNDEDTLRLIQEATLYGLDDVRTVPYGARLILNLQRGIQQGNIPEYDYEALVNLVGRAKMAIIPMEWRGAFSEKPPPEVICQGDIQPFKLLDGTPVGLSFQEMTEAIRSTGRPGSTKTTGACAILGASIRAKPAISVMVIDSKGDGQMDYMCRENPARVLKVRIGRPDRPFFNPWQWARVIREYFLTIFSRRDSKIVLDSAIETGSKQIALSGASELTHAQLLKNITSGSVPAGFPFVPKDFFRSMFSVFYDIDCSPLRHQIACQRGYDLREIVKQGYSVIIDTSAIAGTLQEEFIICTLLAALRQEIINDPVLRARNGTQVVFYIDECTHLSAASKVPGGLPSLVHLSTLVRSSSICLFCVYHSMSIVHPVLNAAGIWLVSQISDGNDISTAGRTFTLMSPQAKSLTDLPKGVAMMRMGNRYTSPFLVTYDRLPDPVKMTDAEIDANNAPILATLPLIVPEHYRKIPVPVTVTPSAASAPVPPPVASATPPAAPVAVHPAAKVAPSPRSVDNDYTAILKDIAAKPFMFVGERAEQLTLPSGKKLNYSSLKIALDDLNAQGFVDDVEVRLAPHAGKPGQMHFLTADGYVAIGSVYTPHRSGYRHDFGQRLIKHILSEKSIPSTIEMTLPGNTKVVDIGVICPVTKLPIAIELPTSTFASEPDQAERNLAAGWARSIVCCLNKTDLEAAIKAFERHSAGSDPRIKVCPISVLKATAMLPDIYDSPDFVVKVKGKTTKRKKGSMI